jgi:hypothetical protein
MYPRPSPSLNPSRHTNSSLSTGWPIILTDAMGPTPTPTPTPTPHKVLSVALGDSIYLWNASDGSIQQLMQVS